MSLLQRNSISGTFQVISIIATINMSAKTSTAISLIYHLANEYHTLIFNASSSNVRQHELDESSCSDGDESDNDIDDDIEEIEDEIMILLSESSRKRIPHSTDTTFRSKKRGKYDLRRLHFTHPVTGKRDEFTFEYSLWYMNYVVDPSPDQKKWSRKFRLRFRMPYDAFLDLAKECEASNLFAAWCSGTGYHRYNKRKVLPLKLLILCSLRYLGRGLTFDDLEEYTGISTETIRLALHKFIKFGSTHLYNKYVKNPSNATEFLDCENEYLSAGFPGCVGSTDASHVIIEKCSYRLRQLHLGYKLAHTARTYNITVNHRRRILHTTSGHPARFNDKTLVLYDHFVNRLHDGKCNELHKFTLMDYDANGEIIYTKYKGCYLIVDNGYLNWSVTVPPLKKSTVRSEIRFSQWLESLRKDVECAFGILKCRWRVLKTGIRLGGIQNCDRVWLTCCALHNMLLDIDGLCDRWEEGVPCFYETTDNEDTDNLPFSIQKLVNPSTRRSSDVSGMGHGNDADLDNNDDDSFDDEVDNDIPITPDEDGYVIIQNLSLNQFRKKLIIHFNIAFKQNKVKWPQRNK